MKWININDKYRINQSGEVQNIRSGRILKKGWKGGDNTKEGAYHTVRIQPKRADYVHHLVALAFLPNPEGKETVDHIDRNRQNNHVSNLRWADRSEQNKNRTLRKRIVVSLQTDAVCVGEKGRQVCGGNKDDGKVARAHDEAKGAGAAEVAGDAVSGTYEVKRMWKLVFLCFSILAGALHRSSVPHSHTIES